MKQLEDWDLEAPNDKTIIFVQWRQLGTLIGRNLAKKKIGFVYYTVSRSSIPDRSPPGSNS
jgi:hypothetical protein